MTQPLLKGLIFRGGFPFDFTRHYVEVCVYRNRMEMLAAVAHEDKEERDGGVMGIHVTNTVHFKKVKKKWVPVTRRTGRIYLNLADLHGKHMVITLTHEFLHAASSYMRMIVFHCKRFGLGMGDIGNEERLADCTGWPMQCFLKQMARRRYIRRIEGGLHGQ